MDKKSRLTLRVVLTLVLIALTLGFIFGNSLQVATDSQAESLVVIDILGAPIRAVVQAVFRFTLDDDTLILIVRKAAHFFEFMVLSMQFACLLHFLQGQPMTVPFLTLLCAVLDEFLQTFVPGRCGAVSDVLIDFGGGVLGMLLILLVLRRHKNKAVF